MKWNHSLTRKFTIMNYSKLIKNPEEKIKGDINDKITEFVSNNFFKAGCALLDLELLVLS